MTKEIINHYSSANNSSISLHKNEDKYIIYFESRKSSHYCTNGCNDGGIKKKCKCKDKDYGHDLWGGRLISNENMIILNDIYEFLKKNIDELSNLNRYDLYCWIACNKNTFLLDYYPDIYNELKSYMDDNINIFSEDFYEEFKHKYINYVGDSDDEELKYNLEYLSLKNNFICDEDDLFQKMDIYMTYKNLDINNIVNDNMYEMFSKIIFINNTYQDMVFKLESTLC